MCVFWQFSQKYGIYLQFPRNLFLFHSPCCPVKGVFCQKRSQLMMHNSELNTQCSKCIAVLSTKVLYSWVKCIGDDQVLVSGKVEHIVVGQERIVGEWQWEGAVTRQWENKATDSTRWPSSTFPHSVFTQNWVEPNNASKEASFPPQIHLAEQELYQERATGWREREVVSIFPKKILLPLSDTCPVSPIRAKKHLFQRKQLKPMLFF